METPNQTEQAAAPAPAPGPGPIPDQAAATRGWRQAMRHPALRVAAGTAGGFGVGFEPGAVAFLVLHAGDVAAGQ